MAPATAGTSTDSVVFTVTLTSPTAAALDGGPPIQGAIAMAGGRTIQFDGVLDLLAAVEAIAESLQARSR